MENIIMFVLKLKLCNQFQKIVSKTLPLVNSYLLTQAAAIAILLWGPPGKSLVPSGLQSPFLDQCLHAL